jgi:exodeoxyribonuclease V beta subunit
VIVRVARPASLPPATERFVVVEASAGTGKTYFLEHRVADLVIGGAELSQILLVTFTDKAVAELRMRIRDLLDRLSRADTSTPPAGVNSSGSISGAAECCWELDDAARARLRAAVTAFDHAPIFTIHGFCHRVLIEDAFAARRLFQQQQIADEVAFDAAFSALLRERFAVASPDKELLAAYLQEGTTDGLRNLLLQCTRAEAQPRRRFDAEAALAIGTTLRAELGTAEQRAHLLETTNWKGQQRHAPGWLDVVGDALAAWDGTAIGVLAMCGKLAKIESLVKYTAPRPALHAALAAALEMMPLEEAIATELLPHVLARIGADKAEHGQFDYQDMLDLVRDALAGPRGPELAQRLRTRTPWVMIDEFQDTDQTQWEIFRTVWLHDEARGLTIVGDPKQAIYGFRGADVATYLDARDQLMKLGAHRVSLAENRRSVAPLVDAVNALIKQPLNELLDQDIRYEDPVRAAGDIACDDARPPITVFELDPEADKDALALAIGAEIERLRARPPVWRHRGTTPAFSLGQVMVLTRSNKESSAVAASLRARGLACAVVESEGLFETREAAELAAVLAAIAAPRDRSARLRALRTRFFDVRWTELMRVVDAPDHHPAIARLFDWAALAVKREYETLFRRLIDDSRFAARALVVGGGERAVINTWHLIELLLEEVARSRGDLHELVVQLQRWIDEHEAVEDDRDVQRAETDADAVRVLTMHKAKGLEAPYVFLYGAASKGKARKVHTLRDAAGRALVFGSSKKAELDLEEAAENQRLAYVALTRAQVRMYLPLYSEKQCDKHSTYAQIQRCLRPLIGRHAAFEVVPVTAVKDPAPPPDALATFDVPAPPAIAEVTPVARAGLAMWSYTRLAHDLDIARSASEPARAASPPVIEIQRAEHDADAEGDAPDELPPDELPPGSDSGLFLHDLFEHVDLRAAEVTPEQLADFGRQRGIAPAHFAHAARLVRETLTQPLGELPPITEATALAREVEFAYPIPGEPGRGLVKGFIDALIAYGDDLWVLDYKSDRLANPARAKEHALEHYGVQARLYSLAADRLRGARTLRGVLFAFVRHGITVPIAIDGDELARYARWLEGLR